MARGALAAALVLPLWASAQQTPAQPARPGQMPVLPLTQLDERALAADLDNRVFTVTIAQPTPIKEVLLLLVRGTSLSIVPDPAIGGSFIGELKNVTVRQALGLILPPLGLDYTVDGAFIRVFKREPETRLFDINYVATERIGAASIGPSAPVHPGASTANVSSTTRTDVFAELATGVRTLLSQGAVFNIDRKAGLLQVTDFPERLDRVATYLDAVQDHVHRQVQIDGRVIEVELNDAAAQTLDWAALAQGGAGAPARPFVSGLRIRDLERFMTALAAQGTVTVIANPRVLALNNETAIVRGASRTPGKTDTDDRSADSVTLSITPQIAADGVVMLSVSPIVTLRTPGADRTPDVSAVRESDTLARVADGDTLVVAGFGRDREVRERRVTGLRGGWFGRSTVVTRKRVELLILLTPKVLRSVSSG